MEKRSEIDKIVNFVSQREQKLKELKWKLGLKKKWRKEGNPIMNWQKFVRECGNTGDTWANWNWKNQRKKESEAQLWTHRTGSQSRIIEKNTSGCFFVKDSPKSQKEYEWVNYQIENGEKSFSQQDSHTQQAKKKKTSRVLSWVVSQEWFEGDIENREKTKKNGGDYRKQKQTEDGSQIKTNEIKKYCFERNSIWIEQ